MKRIKQTLKNIILFLREILKMSRPFSDFSETDLYNIERELDVLMRFPSCKRCDIRSDYCVLEYSNLSMLTYEEYLKALQNPIISIVINDKFNIDVIGILDNTITQNCKSAIEEYLKLNNFT